MTGPRKISPRACPTPAPASFPPAAGARQTFDGCRFKQGRPRRAPVRWPPKRAQQMIGEAQQVGHVREQPGMTRNAIQHPGILILDFALDSAMAESRVFFSGRNAGRQVSHGVERRGRHLQRMKNLAPHPGRQSLAHHDFQRLAQQDEAWIGVFGPFARLSLKRQFQASTKQCHGRGCGLKEVHVGRKPGVVRQQMAQRHMPHAGARRAAHHKAGKQLRQPASPGRAGRAGSAAWQRRWWPPPWSGWPRRRWYAARLPRSAVIVGKASQRILDEHLSSGQHSKRTAGKRALRNRRFQDAIC